MIKKLKLILITPTISSGGAERMMVHLANHLSKDIFDVYLVAINKGKNVVSNFEENNTNFIDLDTPHVRNSLWKIKSLFNKIKPDIVISTLPQLSLFLALFKWCFSKKIKFIFRESSIPSVRKHSFNKYLYSYLYRKRLPKFNLCICQSNFMQTDLIKEFGFPKEKTVVINNLIEFNSFNKIANLPKSKVNYDIILVGGLRKHKGVDRLIKAIKFLKSDLNIGIIGDGPEKSSLEKLSIEEGVQDKVSFLGYLSNPYSYMKEAKVVVLTSHYEGFPNVLIEALGCGTPVVAFDVPGGINEIIDSNKNGFLVKDGDIPQLANAIEKTITAKFAPEFLSEDAFKKYGLKVIIEAYQSSILSVN